MEKQIGISKQKADSRGFSKYEYYKSQLFSAQARQNWPHIFTKQIESLSLEKTEQSAYFAVLFFKDSDLENHKN